MINVIIDSHQEMFYRTSGLEISSHENISSGAFHLYLKIPIQEHHQECLSIGPLSFVHVLDDAPLNEKR